MPKHPICIKLLCTAGLVGLMTAMPNTRGASAQNLNDAVRTLNNIVNPNDAQRLENQARRNGRPRRSVTGTTTAPGYSLLTGPVAITAIRATKAFRATAAIEAIANQGTIAIQETIAISGILPTGVEQSGQFLGATPPLIAATLIH